MLDQLFSHDGFDLITRIGGIASAVAAIAKAVEAIKKKSFKNIMSSKTIKVSITILSGLLAYTLIDRNFDLTGHVHESEIKVSPSPDTSAVEPSPGQVESEPVEKPDQPPPQPKSEDPKDNQEYSVRIVTSANNEALRSRVENLLESKKFKILKFSDVDEDRNALFYFSQNSFEKAKYVAEMLNTKLNLVEADKFVPMMDFQDKAQEKVLQIYLKNQ